MYLLGVAIENEQGEIKLTVLKYGAGVPQHITDILRRDIENDLAGRPAERSLATIALT